MRSETSKKILSETSEETRQKVREETEKYLSSMKTVKQRLEELPEPYRTEAIENCTNPDIEVEYQYEAILYGLDWKLGILGDKAWFDLYCKLISEGK